MVRDIASENLKISEHIREFGWHCLHIFPTEAVHANFSYSIGFNESYEAPEVLIFGLSREKAHALLNECAQLLKSGASIESEIEDDRILAGGYKVMFKQVKADAFHEYLGTALRFYGEKPFTAVVMFLPDKQHKFPWQSGYDDINATESLSIV